jgi:RNA polymerase sigma-70 factor (ECF subfamily)
MGQDRPPPDWHSLSERELEPLFCGDQEEDAGGALVELRRRHDDKLRDQARRQCGGNTELTGEAMQQLDVRLWEKRKTYNPAKGRWITWTKTLLHNIIVDLFRGGPDGPGPAPTDPGGPSGDPMDRFPGRAPSSDRRLKLQELQEAMADCLGRLSPEERTALILQVLEDWALEEIAKEAKAPLGTAGTRVYRAKQKMRECLKRKGYEGGEV